MANSSYQEIEARFLEIDVPGMMERLRAIGAEDRGERFLREIIFYDKDLAWQKYGRKFVRIRDTGDGTFLTFKHQEFDAAEGTEEIEFPIRSEDIDTAVRFLEATGLLAYRRQEKRRHTFREGEVVYDIDFWPRVPPYIEIEGPSEATIKAAAENIGLSWSDAVFENPRIVINKHYGIPVEDLRWFTFDRVE